MRTRRPALAAVAAAALLWLAGCATPGDGRPQVSPIAGADAGLAAEAALPAVDAAWWRAFGDPALDALVERALAAQPSLQAAAARLASARAAADASRGAALPQAGLDLEATRQRFSENGIYPPPLGGSTRTIGTAQAQLSWEIDFFGRHRAAIEAAVGRERAAGAEAAAARTLVAANLVHGYVALARLLAQREVAERTLAQRDEMLALTRQRQAGGLETQVELKQAEAALPDARQQIEAIDGEAALIRHQLAALSAQPPEALAGLRPSMPQLAVPALPERIGADLLGRRADIVAARWRAEAATHDIARARAEFYPDVNLLAFAGFNAIGLDRLFEFGSRNLGAGPALKLPIFDGGRLRAQFDASNAAADAAVADYNGAVLGAVRDVADAGATLASLGRQRTQQSEAAAAAEHAYDFARQRYRAGLGSYLTVLTAENAVLAQRRLGVDLKARTLDAQVNLMHALGGGYAPDATPPLRG